MTADPLPTVVSSGAETSLVVSASSTAGAIAGASSRPGRAPSGDTASVTTVSRVPAAASGCTSPSSARAVFAATLIAASTTSRARHVRRARRRHLPRRAPRPTRSQALSPRPARPSRPSLPGSISSPRQRLPWRETGKPEPALGLRDRQPSGPRPGDSSALRLPDVALFCCPLAGRGHGTTGHNAEGLPVLEGPACPRPRDSLDAPPLVRPPSARSRVPRRSGDAEHLTRLQQPRILDAVEFLDGGNADAEPDRDRAQRVARLDQIGSCALKRSVTPQGSALVRRKTSRRPRSRSKWPLVSRPVSRPRSDRGSKAQTWPKPASWTWRVPTLQAPRRLFAGTCRRQRVARARAGGRPPRPARRSPRSPPGRAPPGRAIGRRSFRGVPSVRRCDVLQPRQPRRGHRGDSSPARPRPARRRGSARTMRARPPGPGVPCVRGASTDLTPSPRAGCPIRPALPAAAPSRPRTPGRSRGRRSGRGAAACPARSDRTGGRRGTGAPGRGART